MFDASEISSGMDYQIWLYYNYKYMYAVKLSRIHPHTYVIVLNLRETFQAYRLDPKSTIQKEK